MVGLSLNQQWYRIQKPGFFEKPGFCGCVGFFTTVHIFSNLFHSAAFLNIISVRMASTSAEYQFIVLTSSKLQPRVSLAETVMNPAIFSSGPIRMLMQQICSCFTLTVVGIAIQVSTFAADKGLPVVFSEDFEGGIDRWEILDPKTWKLSTRDNNTAFAITERKSEYRPAVRSPRHIALIREVSVEDLELTFRVRSTKDTGDHRDCCIFFGWQDRTHFYYAHLGAKPDPSSGQIMIVNDAPRKPLTKNSKRTPWTDDWHRVKLVRTASTGRIAVYFDEMDQPLMEVTDTTFGAGQVGIGSFDDLNEFDDIVLKGSQ